MNLTIIILIIAVALIVAWNVYPPLRAKLRGWSTIIEGIIGTVFTYFGIFAEALEEGQRSGYLPENILTYVPMVLFAWVVMKRIQTKTPVGGK